MWNIYSYLHWLALILFTAGFYIARHSSLYLYFNGESCISSNSEFNIFFCIWFVLISYYFWQRTCYGLTRRPNSWSWQPLYSFTPPSVHFAVIGITYICSCVFVILGRLTHCFGVLKRMCQKRAKCCPKICLKLHKKGGTIGTLTAGTKRRCASWFNVVSTCTYCAPYSWPSSVSHRCHFCVKNSNITKKERALVRKRRSAGTSVYKLVMCISQQRS